MRDQMQTILKELFFANLIRTRAELGWSQAKMSRVLAMDSRSYADIEARHNSCSALTLILFLIYCCSDVNLFLLQFQTIIEGEDLIIPK